MNTPQPFVTTNARIFAALALVFQIVMGCIYGFFFDYLFILEIFSAPMILYFLVLLLLVGFGLLNAYLKSCALSGVGYTLLITAIALQLYFPINALFTKWQVQRSLTTFQTRSYQFVAIGNTNQYLNQLLTYFYGLQPDFLHGASFVEAVKCAIAVTVAFSAMIGRVGHFGVFLLTIIGVIGYQLNRETLLRINTLDDGGSMGIFCFGATLGLVVSLILGKKEETKNHPKYRASYRGYMYGMIGTIFIWVLFPTILFSTIYYRGDSPFYNAAPINMWLALSGSVVSTFATSSFTLNKISQHCVIFGSFAGAVAFSTSSNLVHNPVASLVVGLFQGTLNTLTLIHLGRRINAEGVVTSSSAILTFLLNGLCGGIWSAVFTAFQGGYVDFSQNFFGYTYPIDTDNFRQGGLQVAGTFISVGIALITGILCGLICRGLNKDGIFEFFQDGTYWQTENK